jgi:pyoverdine/dityrosine biosynthesis protein Dit1
MDTCPKCESKDIRKDGIVKQKQRFKCKFCDYRFTVKTIGKPINKKREAVVLFLTGNDYRTIGEIIQTSHVAVFKWIKELEPLLKNLKCEKPDRIFNIEEIEQYLAQNKEGIKAVLMIGFTTTGTDIILSVK